MKRPPDKFLLLIILVLIVLGLFILTSASMGLLARQTGGAGFYNVVVKQAIFALLGLAVLFVASKINYKIWRKFSFIFFILTFLACFLVFVPGLGFKSGGAKRWIDLGPIFFQPSELLKFGFVVYLSSWLASRKEEVKSFKFGLLPFVIITAFVGILLVMGKDIGTLGIFVLTGLILFFLAGGRVLQIATLIFLGILLLIGLVKLEPYRMERILTFLDPARDQSGSGYQIKQSLIAIGSGGIMGRGFGMSVQKFNYLPEPIGDSIFAVFGEEFGFLGSIVLIGLFLLFLYRGFYISIRAPDDFSRLLASGIVILIITGSLINIGAMTGLLPLTGIPLIFISQGGSALVVSLAEIGVLLNISRYLKT